MFLKLPYLKARNLLLRPTPVSIVLGVGLLCVVGDLTLGVLPFSARAVAINSCIMTHRLIASLQLEIHTLGFPIFSSAW
jgi:hypothetical protein